MKTTWVFLKNYALKDLIEKRKQIVFTEELQKELWKQVFFEKKEKFNISIVINRWWAWSSKTRSILQMALNWLITWYVDDTWVYDSEGVFSCVRLHWTYLEKSVYRDFQTVVNNFITELEETNKWALEILLRNLKWNKTNKIFTYWNRLVEFFWCDDQQKVRSARRKYLYCNEANELPYSIFQQLNSRTWRRTYLDFNPDDDTIWIKTELEDKRMPLFQDILLIKSTYKDNPFLSDREVNEIEIYKTLDPLMRKIFWEWEYWRKEWVIFKYEEIERIPEWAKLIVRWWDFWYTNDPTTLVDIYLRNNSIILDERIYETWLKNLYSNEQEKSKSIVWLFEILWITKEVFIIFDSSEPKSIDEIWDKWWPVKWAEKWKDSVNFWIDLIKQRKHYITQSSVNIKKEFNNYVWAKDKDWKPTNIPIDKFNHTIDAVRYWETFYFIDERKSEDVIVIWV